MTVRTRSELEDAADEIRDETSEGANTATRVGGFCRDVVDSMPLADEVTAGAAWSLVLFVDSASAVTPADGSREAPFTTVQAAHDAATAGSTIYVIAYTAAAGLTVTKDIVIAAFRVFTRRSFGGYSRAGTNVSLGAITVSSGTLTLAGVNVSTISATGTVNITDACDVSGAITGGVELRASDSDFGADIALDFASRFSNCTFATGVDITSSATSIEMQSCRFSGTVSIVFSGSAGTVSMDIETERSWTAATETLTNGSVVVMGSAFTSTRSGLAPASGGGTLNFLRADGTWATPPDSTAPTGTAGGALDGTYPNPGIANNAVSNTEAADMAEGTIKLRPAGGGSGDPVDGTPAQALAIILPTIVETFTSGTPDWTKDANATRVGIFLKGSGAGGGALSGGTGGGGGSDGEELYEEFPAALVPDTLNLSIGLAGTAGSPGGAVSATGNAGAFVMSANGGLAGSDGGAGGISYDPTGRGSGGAGGATSGVSGVRGRGGGAGGAGGTNAPGGGGKGYGAGGGGGAGATDGGGGGGGGYGDGTTGGTIAAEAGTATVGGGGSLGIVIITTWRS